MTGEFDYKLDYSSLDLREKPHLYRIGRGEQGVLLVQPYKSEILPHWRFKDAAIAERSAREIAKLFRRYKKERDIVGMDMARKFLQMGYTRARRYANRRSGRKYDASGALLPYENDATKAEAAAVFFRRWKKVEADPLYAKLKRLHEKAYG